MQEGRFVDVKKLAAFNIVFRGRPRVLAEFGLGALLFAGVGVGFLVLAHNPTMGTTALGVYLVFLGLNYAPLLAFALSIKTESAARELLSVELAQQDVYWPRYGAQQVLVLVPLAVTLLAVFQTARRG